MTSPTPTQLMATFAKALSPSWRTALEEELSQPYLLQLIHFLKSEEAAGATIYPEKKNVFTAFTHTAYDDVKVVIIGQDPYHGPGQAHGLSFSVMPGVRPPPSLKNIYKELLSDLNIPIPETGYLMPWADQGVLLLNAILTVRANQPHSHHGQGWEKFTDAVVKALLRRTQPVVFILWGQVAQQKLLSVMAPEEQKRHLILCAAHPSPYSATKFLGCRHFSQANAFLIKKGFSPIDWNLSSSLS